MILGTCDRPSHSCPGTGDGVAIFAHATWGAPRQSVGIPRSNRRHAISPGRVCIRAALYGSARIMELYVCGATTCRRATDIELTVPTEGECRRRALMYSASARCQSHFNARPIHRPCSSDGYRGGRPGRLHFRSACARARHISPPPPRKSEYSRPRQLPRRRVSLRCARSVHSFGTLACARFCNRNLC